MTWLEGRTEGGTVLPVQITDDGRLVAQGLPGSDGPQGPEGSQGPQGPQGPQGEYGPGDDVDLGSGTFAGSVITQGNLQAQNDSGQFIQIEADAFDGGTKIFGFYDGSGYTSSISPDGSASFAGNVQTPKLNVLSDENTAGVDVLSICDGVGEYSCKTVFYSGGAMSAAGNTCGFTSEGEIYMTSRGTRYKLVVAGGLVTPEPYTREMELRERAEALKERIDEKRKPRSTDSVPED